MRIARRALPIFIALLSAACARQCGGLGGGPPEGLPLVIGPDGVKRYLNDKGAYKAWYDYWGRLERIEYDRNGDGHPDHIAHYQGGRTPRMIEIDEDNNGLMDRWEYYDEASILVKLGDARRGRGPDRWTYLDATGKARRIEYDEDGDGQFERAELFDDGKLVAVELDTSRDGKPHRWQRWLDGKMRGEDIDTDGDGKADRRIAYDDKGHILGVQKIE